MEKTIHNLLNWGIKQLKITSSSPFLDAEVLLAHVLSPPLFSPSAKQEGEIERGWLYANPEHKLSKLQATSYKLLIKKRARHWPIAYLTGHKEFFGLDFKVTPSVLIPRPETELLVERVLRILQANSYKLQAVIDLGTGSGNIIISLVKTLLNKPFSPGEGRSWKRGRTNDLKFFAVDSSDKALIIAKLNARRHGVARKIKFLRGHLLDPLFLSPFPSGGGESGGGNFSPTRRGRFPPDPFSPCPAKRDRGRLRGGRTLVIANLPYGWKQWKNNTSAETMGLKFEPQQALFTKEQGLYLIHRLFKQLHAICHPRLDRGSRALDSRPPIPAFARTVEGMLRGNDNIAVLLEFDPRQKQKLTSLAKKYFPYAKLLFHKDLTNQYRVTEINLTI